MNTKNRTLNTTLHAPRKTDNILNITANFWFIVAVAGQWAFVLYILLFYGGSVAQGDLSSWNNVLAHGLISGDPIGNIVLGAHIFLAFVITLGGPLQLIPQIRNKYKAFHRWNGRLYIITAFIISIAGLYMITTRGVVGGTFMAIGNSINALLIMIFAALTLRTALAHNFSAHRRWALRTFIVVNGVWFMRIGYGLWALLTQGSFVGSTENLDGPFDAFLALAHTLLPLAVLEIYLYIKAKANPKEQIAMAITLFILTIAMGAGIFMATLIFWLPHLG